LFGVFQVQVAVKMVKQERMQSDQQTFLKETAVMQSLDHDNIARLYGVVLDRQYMLVCQIK
jgi:serine/threonine protein kinase